MQHIVRPRKKHPRTSAIIVIVTVVAAPKARKE
jgi:hypothetical protein